MYLFCNVTLMKNYCLKIWNVFVKPLSLRYKTQNKVIL